MGRVNQIDFLNGGADILVADDNSVMRWNADKLHNPVVAPVEQLPPGFEVRALAARPDRRELLIAFANRVMFLDPEKLKPIRTGPSWLPRLRGWRPAMRSSTPSTRPTARRC